MTEIDWSYMQSFAAVAEHGSLTLAARAMRSSQPTLSRHIAALETQIGTRLFERSRDGMTLTDAGVKLADHARHMAEAAARFSVIGEGQTAALTGTVRITASQIVASFLLPAVLARLRPVYPEIDIEVVASDSTDNLLRREADIAVRMYRPTQLDVVAKRIGEIKLGAYAAKHYIARRGLPNGIADFTNHDVIGYDRSPMIIKGMRAAGLDVTRDFFAFRCDDQVVCWQMVLAGCGIGFGQFGMGDSDPRVQRVSGEAPVAYLPVWLTAHPDLRTNARVRTVFDWLAREILSEQ